MSAAARRAVGIVCVGIVLATACVFLGRWQWNRHVWRDAAIAVVTTNYAADPVPLDDVLASTDETLGKADEWRTVEVVGRYDSDATVLLRNRPVDGHPAYAHAITELKSSGELGRRCRCRRCPYLNNVVEQDHRFVRSASLRVSGSDRWRAP